MTGKQEANRRQGGCTDRAPTPSTSSAAAVGGGGDSSCSRCLAGGGGTSPSDVSAASAPPSTVLPAWVAAPTSCVDTGGGGAELCRRWRPLMPVRPPVTPVPALSSPPTRPWPVFWTCSRGPERQEAAAAAALEGASRANAVAVLQVSQQEACSRARPFDGQVGGKQEANRRQGGCTDRAPTPSTSSAAAVGGGGDSSCSRCLAGGGGTSPSVVSAASAPPSTVLPAWVAAPTSCVDTGGGGAELCRRWRPLMPVRPPVTPVPALSSPPTRPWPVFWTCS